MSGSIDVGARARRATTARRGASAASAGMPEAAADARIAELENRLARLEGTPGDALDLPRRPALPRRARAPTSIDSLIVGFLQPRP